MKKQGVEVEWYNISGQSKVFLANQEIADLLHGNGKKILPVTIVNGKVFKTRECPCMRIYARS